MCEVCVCVCACVLLVQLHTFATRQTFDTLIATMMTYFLGVVLKKRMEYRILRAEQARPPD